MMPRPVNITATRWHLPVPQHHAGPDDDEGDQRKQGNQVGRNAHKYVSQRATPACGLDNVAIQE